MSSLLYAEARGGKSGHLKVYVKYCKNQCVFLSGAGGASTLKCSEISDLFRARNFQ